MSDDMIYAPWTPEQVEILNCTQQNRNLHPFTCGHCRDEYGIEFIREDNGELRQLTAEEEAVKEAWWRRFVDEEVGLDEYIEGRPVHTVINDHVLVATENGWTCPTCDYTQNWAHACMADREFSNYNPFARGEE